MSENFCSMELQIMSPQPLKAAVKRGALIAAANWQVRLIQASAAWLFRLLLAAPVVGSLFLVALAIDRDPASLISLEWRDMSATILKLYASFVDRGGGLGVGAVYDRISFES